MARHSFGTATDDDDILEIQGIEYHLQPIGMRAMRKLLNAAKGLTSANGDDPTPEVTEERLDAAIDLVVGAVRTDERDALREHIEDRVPPNLLVSIANAITTTMSDLDPTQPASSSDGSSPAGPPSTATALPAASTPTT